MRAQDRRGTIPETLIDADQKATLRGRSSFAVPSAPLHYFDGRRLTAPARHSRQARLVKPS